MNQITKLITSVAFLILALSVAWIAYRGVTLKGDVELCHYGPNPTKTFPVQISNR
jgi:hypothetical protein